MLWLFCSSYRQTRKITGDFVWRRGRGKEQRFVMNWYVIVTSLLINDIDWFCYCTYGNILCNYTVFEQTSSPIQSPLHLENPEIETRWYFKYFLGKSKYNSNVFTAVNVMSIEHSKHIVTSCCDAEQCIRTTLVSLETSWNHSFCPWCWLTSTTTVLCSTAPFSGPRWWGSTFITWAFLTSRCSSSFLWSLYRPRLTCHLHKHVCLLLNLTGKWQDLHAIQSCQTSHSKIISQVTFHFCQQRWFNFLL